MVWDVNHRCDAGQARLRTGVLAFPKVRDVPWRGTVADVTEWMVSDDKVYYVYFLWLPLVFSPTRLLMQYPRSPARVQQLVENINYTNGNARIVVVRLSYLKASDINKNL